MTGLTATLTVKHQLTAKAKQLLHLKILWVLFLVLL